MKGERGSASVVGVAVLAVAVVVGLAVATAAGLVADHARARAAADLAALAGAYAVRASLAGGGEEPCTAAERTAHANGAHLTACRALGDGSVQVTAASGKGKASARAGPDGRGAEMEGPGGGSG